LSGDPTDATDATAATDRSETVALADPLDATPVSPPAEEPDPLIGRTIAGKFKIERRLGAGAMGAVYRAQQTALERPVAIKVMHGGFAADENYAARFHREAKAASRLDHPNLIRVHDYGEEPDGLLYIAMEFLDCRDLFTILAEDWPLPQERVVDLLSQILSGLAEAHRAGVMHRDLKPENIMVLRRKAEDGEPIDVVKVCDFGIAKFTDVSEDAKALGTSEPRKLTTAGLVIGTPEYMSPEQARGETYDARSDVYAVGVILYELLTRRLPFEGKTSIEVVFKAMYEEPRKLDASGPTTAPALDSICLKAMSKSPEDRYQSAREMRAALQATRGTPRADSASSSSPGPSLPERAGPVEVIGAPASDLERAPPLRARRSNRALNGGLAALAAVLWTTVLVIEPPAPRAASFPASSSSQALGAQPSFASAPASVSEDAAVAPSASVAVRTSSAFAEPLASASSAAARPSARHAPREPPPPIANPVDPVAPSDSATAGQAPAADTVLSIASVPPGSPSSPSASPPTAASAPAPSAAPAPVLSAATPSFHLPTARVELGRVKCNSAAVMSGSVSRTLGPLVPRFTACYRAALATNAGAAGEAVATLHLESDDEGYVTVAHVTGGASSASAARCIEGISREVHLDVDTGTANVDVTLVFKPL